MINFLLNKGILIAVIIGIIVVGVAIISNTDSENPEIQSEISPTESNEPVPKKYTVTIEESIGVSEP